MVMEYYISFKRKVDAYVAVGKAENESHAFYLLKPKFRELFVEDKDLHCCGFIDRVYQDYNGFVTLGDYKTSSKYGIGFPLEYKRQLAIYALLYKNQTKEMPDMVGVHFLRYGESFYLEVTPHLLRWARETIADIYSKTRSTNIEDYPLNEGVVGKFCNFIDLHDGSAEWEDKLREQKLAEAFKKLGEKND